MSLVLLKVSLSQGSFSFSLLIVGGQALCFYNATRDNFDCHNCYIKEDGFELFTYPQIL